MSEFYRHKEMADGHLNKCKCCTRFDVAARYLSPDGRAKVTAYERMRYQTEHRKAKTREYRRQRREKHPEKYAAEVAVRRAIEAGLLIRKPCEVCGDPKSEAHHLDYAHPLAIRWMCFKHHREIGHGQIVTAK